MVPEGQQQWGDGPTPGGGVEGLEQCPEPREGGPMWAAWQDQRLLKRDPAPVPPGRERARGAKAPRSPVGDSTG